MSSTYYREQVEESLRSLEYCWNFIYEQKKELKLYRQIASVELRKLLCDENPSIYAVDPNPKFSSFELNYTKISGPYLETVFEILPEHMVSKKPNLMSLDNWLSQKIIYYDRQAEDISNEIDEKTFQAIIDNLYQNDKKCFTNFYHPSIAEFKDEKIKVFSRNDSKNIEQTKNIYKILNKVGYNFIDVRKVIKLIANKFGAHTSPDHPIGLFHLNLDDKIPIHFDVILCYVIVDLRRILGK
jgi:hypothetical protein